MGFRGRASGNFKEIYYSMGHLGASKKPKLKQNNRALMGIIVTDSYNYNFLNCNIFRMFKVVSFLSAGACHDVCKIRA